MDELRSTRILAREHRWIGRMLSALEQLASDSLELGRLDAGTSTGLLSLFEYFADGLHQRKEEAALYMQILQRADLAGKSDISKLLGQHENDRRLMRAMRANLLGAVFGLPAEVRDFARYANTYLTLHRSHMGQEEEVLFPLAQRLLDEEGDEIVCRGFRKVERELGIESRALGERIHRVCDHLGVPSSGGRTLPTHTSF